MATASPALNIPELVDQEQYPLFRLPRELRDEIYGYCAYDEESLAYDYPSKTLKYASGGELDLPRTWHPSTRQYQHVHSLLFRERGGHVSWTALDISRFEHLLYATRWTKMLMLHYVAECVTNDDVAKVIEAYPAVSRVFRSCFRVVRLGLNFRMISRLSHMPRDVFTASFCDAVQYALDLTATHPKYEELISKVCESSQYYPWPRPPFIKGSHRQVLGWRPHPWLIPTRDELCRMENLLTMFQGPNEERAKEYQGVKFYFSATAICIAALGRLPPSTRKQLRSIVLREDCRSVGNTEVHAEGLISYCTENHKLRFLMQAGFSTILAPSFWSKPDQLLTYPNTGTRAHVHDYIRILVEFLIRTAALTELGMPKGSFAVAFDARSQQAVYIWRYISKAVSARDHLRVELLNHEERNGTEEQVLEAMYARLWRLPVGLSSVVEDIIKAVPAIRLETPAGERLKHKPVKPYATWSFIDWVLAYRPMDEEVMFPGDAAAYFKKFFR